jgi:nitrite reductase/ring-hydroxylating ferredoxin subunit
MTQRLCSLSEIGDKGKEIQLQIGESTARIMLFLRDGQVRAFHNVCPHQGRNLNLAPDHFLFTPNGLLICAHHGACFSLDSGACLQGPSAGASLKAVEVEVREEAVWLAD